MPVKKNKAKINKKVKAEIKEAVERIPGLIFEHVRLQNQEEKPKPVPVPYNYDQMQKKKMMMWSGVIILTIVVFAMWFLNASITVRDLKEGYTKVVPGITETAKKSWEETMPAAATNQTDKIGPANNLDDLKNQIKNNLISIFYAQQASTTVSSTN